MIVAPPRTGKTVLLQQVSQAISQNHPELSLVMLLVDERPEEVTDMRRSVQGEVVASSLDCDVESHVRLSQLVIERCKRMAEAGKEGAHAASASAAATPAAASAKAAGKAKEDALDDIFASLPGKKAARDAKRRAREEQEALDEAAAAAAAKKRLPRSLPRDPVFGEE